MIIPLVAEDGWAPFLDQLPEWRPSSALPLLIVVPHPDDEVLGVGGLIATLSAAKVEISVVAVTDGEHAYPDDPDAGLGILRSAEQTAALEHLGVPSANILRLRFPDSDVMSQLPELVERLSAFTSQQTQLFAPWRGDFHPDHAACGIAAERWLEEQGRPSPRISFGPGTGEVQICLRDCPCGSFRSATTHSRPRPGHWNVISRS